MPQLSSNDSIGSPFIELQSVDSTNIYALNRIHAASLPDRQGFAHHGMAFFAHGQEAGKGQRGKTWISEKSENIILSIIIQPGTLPVSGQFQLSACTALAIHKFFSHYAGDDTTIKWPNDLYWQDRKAGGILIENIIRSSNSGAGKWEWGVIGIGININQTIFPPELQNPVSLKQITGKNYNAVTLARELCSILDVYYRQLINNGFEKIYTDYISLLYKKDKTVKLKKGARIFEAHIKSVSPTGQLIIQHATEEIIEYGEVEWLF